MKALATCVECFLVQGLLMSMVILQHNTESYHVVIQSHHNVKTALYTLLDRKISAII